MRVWIGCLACYNAGRVVGKWFDGMAAGEATSNDVHGRNQQVWLRYRNETGFIERLVDTHEELWVMDMDETCGWMTQEASPAFAQEVAETLEVIQDEHYDPEVVLAWADNKGIRDEVIRDRFDGSQQRDFDDDFCGLYDSEKDYAYTFVDETGYLDEMPDSLASYFDYDSFARDLFFDYYGIRVSDGLAVFRSN